MTTDEIRKSYLEFFKAKGHTLVPSDSLVPHNDPTLLFTGAGMNQFKGYFLGVKKDLKRAASSQKCLRTGDLEEVGRTPYHHSFFEMLGNFSFGDYFKKEAIEWAWEFLTEKLQISKKRLRVSVHKDDDEAYKIWRDQIKIKPEWIYKLGDKDNFWPSNAPKDGPNGPCGPCSEIYFDQDPSQGDGGTAEDKRFAEIWNLVFTQFDRQNGGKLVPLAQKNIDTGMGLERLACVLQGKETNYEIDTLRTINDAVESALKVNQANLPKNLKYSVYAITDHLRAIVVSMADGVIPSNESRGYVIRKLIRRALWHAHKIIAPKPLEGAFLFKIVKVVVAVLRNPYPELADAEASITQMMRAEEERFLEALEKGLNILNDRLKSLNGKMLHGEIVFELYDTYGFPDELTRMIAEERGLEIDQKGFERLMEEQRKRAKDASKISGSIFVTSEIEKKLAALPATKFLGYSMLESKAKIIFADIKDGKGVMVLDQTPLYAESGGQVGDHGILKGKNLEAKVIDTQKKDSLNLHIVEILKGSAKTGDEVSVMADKKRRDAVMRNHTATHLLHAALRNLLGDSVRQLGSLVAPDRLRFDYSYGKPLSAEQLRAIEESVNAEILKDTPVSKEEKAIEIAKEEGAIAFFGDKYGDKVRVVTVPGYSKEFCGGTHCDRTGQIGLFLIVSDSSIASGTRRIEALTGDGALAATRGYRDLLGSLCQDLKATPEQLGERIEKMRKTIKQLEKDRDKGHASVLDAKELLAGAKKAGSVQWAAYLGKSVPMNQLLPVSDLLKNEGKKTVYLLAAENDEKVHLILGMSRDLAESSLDLRELMREIGPLTGVQGGGRRDLVQGGGENHGQLQKEWALLEDKAIAFLASKG